MTPPPPDFKFKASFAGSLKDAQTAARSFNKEIWPDLRVDLVEVPNDKTNVLLYLNGDESVKFTVLKTFKLTPRGGLTAEDDA